MDPYPSNPLTGGTPAYTTYDQRSASSHWGEKGDYRRWGFYAGLAGGVLILVGAFATALFMMATALFGAEPFWWRLGDDEGWFPWLALVVGVWGLLTGAVVLVSAASLKESRDSTVMPGIGMIVGGLLSFFALGGFLVGGILAIVGGVLAIAGARHVFGVRGPRLHDRERGVP